MLPCVICNKEGAKLCQGCHSACYCSKECQTKDWSTHKLLCSKIKDGSHEPSLNFAHAVQGVRISCSGDIRVLGVNKFKPVAVAVFDPVFKADKSTSSEMVGVPLRARKIPPHPAWKHSGEPGVYENQEATRLFRDMDPEHGGGFGIVSWSWDLGVGSVLVVRDDGKDITPQQVEAVCYYSWQHTTDMFQAAFEYGDRFGSNKGNVELAALFTPDKFRKFFADFKAKKMVNDASWVTAESPV